MKWAGHVARIGQMKNSYMITNDVSDYINSLVTTAHIICNRPLFWLEKLKGKAIRKTEA
jgi:hypothetical protein